MKIFSNYRKRKKQPEKEDNTRPMTEEERANFKLWCEETGASKCYTSFTPLEDPFLVEGAGDFNSQLKRDLIISLHKKCGIN